MNSTIKQKRFERVSDLFGQAMDLSPEEQEMLLRSKEETDRDVAIEVRQLLAIDKQLPAGKITRNFIDITLAPAHAQDDLIGTTLGPYRLVKILGKGGSGVVYLSERDDKKFSSRVAIKIVNKSTGDSRLSARFKVERQILATLNHGNVARLLDAGESLDGYPYIVMEYVEGDAIDRYCSAKQLTVRERLHLFLRICSGVHYAHRNLIVHSDLKPSNILVTEDGIPKLLDFGIAKLLVKNGATPALTSLDDRALTPEYSSPEQISGRAVNTASDIYTLGVLLYELLCGLSPYKFASANRLELERSICLTDPLRPSAAIANALSKSHTADNLIVANAADDRKISPATLRKELSGDLDAIVMRALRKEPDKRYSSVEAFAADIQRYLDIEPVEARRGNWFYYAGRYLRRNAIPVGAATIVLVSLTVFSAVTYSMYRQALADRDNSERIANFMTGVFKDANPIANAGQQVTAVELLNSASAKISGAGNDPEVRARLLTQMGEAYLNLGRYTLAAEHLRTAAAIERARKMHGGRNLARVLIKLASAERGTGDFAAAEKLHQEAMEILEAENLTESADFAELLRSMAILEHNRGDLKKAEGYYQRSLMMSRKSGDAIANIAFTIGELAALNNWAGNLQAAEQLGRESFALYQSLPETFPERLRLQSTLADVLFQRGRLQDAGQLLEGTIKTQRLVYRDAGPELINSLGLLAKIRSAQGAVADSEALVNECLAKAERDLGATHYQTGYYHTSVAINLLQHKQDAAAIAHLDTALSIFAATLPADHQYVASANHWKGEALLGLRRNDDAAAALNAALSVWTKTQAPRWMRARTESALGQALLGTDRIQAEKYLRDAYLVLKEERGAEDEATRLSFERLKSINAAKHERKDQI